jgi:circadian clock protein KaiC
MYITLSETADELRASAATHGWSLDDVSIVDMVPESGLDPEMDQTLLPPSEFEPGKPPAGSSRGSSRTGQHG